MPLPPIACGRLPKKVEQGGYYLRSSGPRRFGDFRASCPVALVSTLAQLSLRFEVSLLGGSGRRQGLTRRDQTAVAMHDVREL